jgi:predicted NAD-dependent protein-ADP-ribosyltransferase YbiA (DUF1768 family)
MYVPATLMVLVSKNQHTLALQKQSNGSTIFASTPSEAMIMKRACSHTQQSSWLLALHQVMPYANTVLFSSLVIRILSNNAFGLTGRFDD